MIYRIFPNKDTTITSFKVLNVAKTGSNLGASEILQVFKKAGVSGSTTSAITGSVGRVLLQFDVSEFDTPEVPALGATYHLVMRHAQHSKTLPSSYDMEIIPLAKEWDEGAGIDFDSFSDKGFANWDKARQNVLWTTAGGDVTGSIVKYSFDTGFEDIDLDVTSMVEQWRSGSLSNYGMMIRMSSSLEVETNFDDYFVKMFHSRDSFFGDKRPYLEARWDNSLRDDRRSFVFDNSGSLYLYNLVQGTFTDLVGIGTGSNVLDVRIVDLSGTVLSVSASHTGDTGVYSASFVLPSSSYSGSLFSDIWSSGSTAYLTGTFTPGAVSPVTSVAANRFVMNITNLKNDYGADEFVRFQVFSRTANYNPAVVLTASSDPRSNILRDTFYRIENDRTKMHVVPFGTGSLEYTRLSRDENGNHFDFHMRALTRGEVYRIVFLIQKDGKSQMIDKGFKFKVI